jgi:hypothetical protein
VNLVVARLVRRVVGVVGSKLRQTGRLGTFAKSGMFGEGFRRAKEMPMPRCGQFRAVARRA